MASGQKPLLVGLRQRAQAGPTSHRTWAPSSLTGLRETSNHQQRWTRSHKILECHFLLQKTEVWTTLGPPSTACTAGWRCGAGPVQMGPEPRFPVAASPDGAPGAVHHPACMPTAPMPALPCTAPDTHTCAARLWRKDGVLWEARQRGPPAPGEMSEHLLYQ